MKTKLISIYEGLNMSPILGENSYEKDYLQRELIYSLQTGRKRFNRPERTQMNHIFTAGECCDVLVRTSSCLKFKPVRARTFNRKADLVVDKDLFLSVKKDQITNMLDRYFSYYKVQLIETDVQQSFKIENNIYTPERERLDYNEIRVRLCYKAELVRWGLIEYDLLEKYKPYVYKTKGIVKLRPPSMLKKKQLKPIILWRERNTQISH